jgi:23S rRNA (guanosine2251-2'-O)-methyltransferase
MSRRKKSHQSHGTANRPRFWGKHAVAAALDNPDRKVLRAWATREAAGFMRFPKDVQVTLAEAPDLGRLVPHDAPHQGVVIEVEPLEESWLDDVLADGPERAILLVLDQVTDPHNVGAILRSAAAFGAVAIVTQDRHSPPESGALAKAASGALERVPWVRVVNLARALEQIGEAGFWRIGLAGDAEAFARTAASIATPWPSCRFRTPSRASTSPMRPRSPSTLRASPDGQDRRHASREPERAGAAGAGIRRSA